MAEKTNFDIFESELMKLVGELELKKDSVSRLREVIDSEGSRAERAEAERDGAERAAREARAEAAEAAAGAQRLGTELARAQEDLVAARTHLDISEKEKSLLELRLLELTSELSTCQRQLSHVQTQLAEFTAQRTPLLELQERTKKAVEEANFAAQQLECEVRRVERAAGGGAELRERARLAAAAHARARRFADSERRLTAADLAAASRDLARLQAALCHAECRPPPQTSNLDESLNCNAKLKNCLSALDNERARSAKLEKALAALAADNAELSASAAAAERASSAAAAASAALAQPDSSLKDSATDRLDLQPPSTAENNTEYPSAQNLHSIKAIDMFLED